MAPRNADLTVVVRECGERTADACVQRLGELLAPATIVRVAAPSFDAVLAASLRAGHAAGRPWTVCIDADVLPAAGLLELVDLARSLDDDTFVLQGLVEDRLMLCQRPAGNHVYRTALLGIALPLLGAAPSLRPETALIQAMATKGYPLRQARHVVGLHDHEQYYRDLYAKAWLHARKHAAEAALFLPAWRALAARDDDFKVALAAHEDACASHAPATIARAQTAAAAARALARLGIAERAPLSGVPRADTVPDTDALADWRPALQAWFDARVFPRQARGLRTWQRAARGASRLRRTLATLWPLLRPRSR